MAAKPIKYLFFVIFITFLSFFKHKGINFYTNLKTLL